MEQAKRLGKGLVGRLAAACFLLSLTGSGLPAVEVSEPADFHQSTVDPLTIIRNYFTEKGFQSGSVIIPELGVQAQLKENQFYRLENNVENVYSRILDIRDEFGLQTPFTEAPGSVGWCGVLSAECCGNAAYAYVVLIKRNLSQASRIYTTAHEHGHFLWYIDGADLIYNTSTHPDYLKSQIRTNSDFAVMCGWLALKRANFLLRDCMIIQNRNETTEKNIERIKKLVDRYYQAPEPGTG